MTETTRAQCPACGANIDDDGRSRVIECAYCKTRVTLRREPKPAAPPPLPKPQPRPGGGRAWPVREEDEHAAVRLSPAFEDEARATARRLRRGWGFVFLSGFVAAAIVYVVYFIVVTDFGSNLTPWNEEAALALLPAGIVGFIVAACVLVYLLMTD